MPTSDDNIISQETLMPEVSTCRNQLVKTLMFICMQKINFITHFFLNILQRNSNRVILGNLVLPGHIHLN